MKRADHDDLVRLAELYDTDSRDTFLSVYVDLGDPGWKTALEERAREIGAVLDDEAPVADEAIQAVIERVADLADAAPKEAKAMAVFASPERDMEEVFALGARVDDRLVVDSSPYISPLAEALEDVPSFVLVLLDSARAAIWRVEEGDVELEASRTMDLIGRHKKGGFSQMRYQRHRQGRVESFLDQVAERLERVMAEEGPTRIVLAGPGQTKQQLHERLPQHLAQAVDAVEDVDLEDPRNDPDLARFISLLQDADAEEDKRVIERLKDDVRGGGLAKTGAFAVARAARDGQVDTLVVLRGAAAGGRKCEEHQSFFAPDGRCSCGSEGTEVDLLEEAVEHTLRTDGVVRSVEPPVPFLERRDGVGAFLRW